MMTARSSRIVLLACLGVVLWLAPPALAGTQKIYDFKVLLDDEEIGTQRFMVSAEGDRTRVQVDASFDVKFWLFTAYSYRHSNVEVWEGQCLHEMRAQTNDNGDEFFVRGRYQDGRLRLKTHEGRRTVEGCVKTYAYWNPDWFRDSRLLNSQTGELQRVEISTVGKETITVRGTPVRTEHQRIKSEKFTIDLWYTENREWVALQSTTSDGGKLFYQLQ